MGGLFGKSKTTSTIPDWVRQPAEQNIANARNVAALGYVPYYGPDVAAFTPMQEASFQNTADAMSAFGMAAPSNPMAGMPTPQTFAGGVRGWSSAPMYEAAVEALRLKNPAQYNAIMSMLDSFRQQAQPAVNPIQSILSGGGGGGMVISGDRKTTGVSDRTYEKSNLYSSGGILGNTLSRLSDQKSDTRTTSGTSKTTSSTSKSSTSTRR